LEEEAHGNLFVFSSDCFGFCPAEKTDAGLVMVGLVSKPDLMSNSPKTSKHVCEMSQTFIFISIIHLG